MTTVTFNSSGSWTAPAGVTSVDCQCWGEGGNGAAGLAGGGSHSGGGGGGGEFAEETTLAVTPGSVYNFTIGAGGTATNTSFPGDSVTVTAHAGGTPSGTSQGSAGTGSTNSIHHDGGHGGSGLTGSLKGGGGGGSSAGTAAAGNAGGNATGSPGASGGSAPSGGAAGGDGASSSVAAGNAGSAPGGAGGGGSTHAGTAGGSGAAGQVTLTYTAPVSGAAALAGAGTLTAQGGPAGNATLPGVGTLTAARAGSGNATLAGAGTLTASATQRAAATLAGVGTLAAAGGLPAPAAVNQWATTFTQPAAFGTTPPALQSLVVPLTPAFSVGGGTGTPTAGNWLFCLAGWNQGGLPASTVGDADDIHSFWRPGNEATSTWAVSTPSANSRCSIWYTPNIARVPGNVYVAPSGVQAGQACLVVEIAGLGPWDTVTGISTAYSAAATTLGLSLSAPSAAAFTIACVCGDTTAVTQAFAPASWTTLSTVSVTNGVDNTCDAVLTSAFLPSTSGSISVSGTASAASDLSGVILQVQVTAASPVPAANNPNWPFLKFEAAFGAGFQTPQDQMTWTDLTSRLWSWNETTGIQYQLGQIQATDLNLELDNFDALLSSDNPASYFYTASGANWHPSSAFYDTLVSAAPPLAWWILSDAAGSGTAADSSGNAHTGTATSVTFGNASQAVTGNNSASFASGSTSHIISSYNPALSFVTVEAWVNKNGLSQSGNPRIAASSHTDADSKGFQLFLSGGTTPQVAFGNGSGSGSVTASSAIPASGWTHLAGTWDGTTITLYVNGVAAGTAGLGGTMAAGTAAGVGIGYGAAYAGDYFNGLIAEVAVYGNALTASQIAAHYTAGPSVTGTPLRLRAAIGTIGGVTANRWYVIQRNAEQWPQQVDPAYRRRVAATATDIWSVLSSSGPSPYRGEVRQDAPYAWWPCDDQPLTGGVLPVTLRNAATGNANVLNITLAPGGTLNATPYTNAGIAAFSYFTPFVASYTVAAQQGWLYGDPQSSVQSYATSNPVTQNPGAAAWEQTGCQGPNGNRGWWLSCNDAGFPPLSAGVCAEGWFNWLPYGSSTADGTVGDNIAQQPKGALTLLTLATASLPVAILQLDSSGHLVLITYNGSTPTTHAVYSTTDLRNQGWFHVAVNLTTSTWAVYLNGGVTTVASGSGTSMTSAWTYLLVNADMGANGGGSTANLAHAGNVSAAHLAVYPAQLTAWRILAHYCAGMTGFGLLPAPQAVSLATLDAAAVTSFFLDGTACSGTGYGGSQSGYGFSARVVSVVGSYTSGPSAYSASGFTGPNNVQGDNVQVTWTGLGERFNVYTATQAGSETQAEVTASNFACFISGYGGSATSTGVDKISGGSGASPPAAASALGDTVQQRLERILGYASATYPGRCIDPASLAVQAATDIGGQQTGQNLASIAASDGGMLFIDNLGSLTYWQKSHLASQYSSPVWTIGPANTPYYREFDWVEDPQRVFNAILVTPFSPDGSSLADITPSQAAQVNASQAQYGAQPHQVTSYLQSQTEMQNQANWIFEYFGQSQVRAENVRIDAAPYPAAFPMVLGINVGDVVTAQNWQIGGGGFTDTFRVTRIRRTLVFGGDDGEDSVRAELILTLDPEPASYWS